MNKLLIASLCCFSLLRAEQGNSSKPVTAPDPVIIAELKGVVLFGPGQDADKYRLSSADSFQTVGLALPGSSQELAHMLQSKYIGQPLTKKTLFAIRQDIIVFYQNQYRPIVTIDIPKQEVTQGYLRLVVTEGVLGDITCQGNTWFSCDTLKGYVRLKPGKPIDSKKLLNDIAWMNRNPFRHTDLVLSAGKTEGTTDIELMTTDRRPFRLYGGMDNTGTKQTESGRWFAGFNWGDAFSADQLLTYQYTASFSVNTFQSHTVNYIAPLPWRDQVMIYGGYSKSEPHIKGFDSSGHSGQASFRYIIPCGIMFADWLKEVQLGFDYKNTNNNIEFAEFEFPPIVSKNVNISQGYVGFNFGMGGDRHKFSCSFQGYASPGKLLPNETDADYQDLRYKATSTYVYARGMMQYWFLPQNGASIWVQARGQYSNRNLLQSEEFALGGYDTVRGYNEREVNADEATCFNLEIQSPKMKFLDYFWNLHTKDQITLLAFGDFGWGTSHTLMPGEDANQFLAGVGPGIRYEIPPYFSLRLDLGFRLHKTQFTNGPFAKLHVGVMANY